MDKLPLYGPYRQGITTAYNQIKEGFKKKEWGLLVSYLFIVLLIVIVAFFGIKAAYHEAFPKDQVTIIREEGYKPPTLKLTYVKENPIKDENGQLHTLFTIQIDRPPGAFQEIKEIVVNIKDAECSKPTLWGTASIERSALIADIYGYNVECISNKPIIDDNNLFSLNVY